MKMLNKDLYLSDLVSNEILLLIVHKLVYNLFPKINKLDAGNANFCAAIFH